MDRESVISFMQAYYSHSISLSDVQKFLKGYCIDRGKKDDDDLAKFLMVAALDPSIFLNYAIQWYRDKFNINIITKHSPNAIGGAVIILIY